MTDDKRTIEYLKHKIEQLRISCGNDHERFLLLSKRLRKQFMTVEEVIAIRTIIDRNIKIDSIIDN